jgi:L-rhamnono-1,4-lactonase
MCKPDLTIYNLGDRNFIAWRTAMYALSKCDKTYMKVSGGFPEMTESLRRRSPEDIFEAVHPWLGVVLATFGPSRMIFASDWPVCTVGVDDEDETSKGDDNEDEDEEPEYGAWGKWKAVVDRMCYMASLGEEDRALLFGGTALKAYGIGPREEE